MARKKEPPKPLFAVKHEFVESLDNLAQEAINFLQAVEQVVKMDLVKEPGKSILQEQARAFRAALSSN